MKLLLILFLVVSGVDAQTKKRKQHAQPELIICKITERVWIAGGRTQFKVTSTGEIVNTAEPDTITLRCTDDTLLDIPVSEWPPAWEKILKVGTTFRARYEDGRFIAMAPPPKHVNGPCRHFRRNGEENIHRPNCIVTP